MPENHETNWPAEAVPRRPMFSPKAGGGHPQPRREPDVVPVLHMLREGLLSLVRHGDAPDASPASIHEAFRLLDRMGLAPDGGGEAERREDKAALARHIEHKERIEGVEQEVRDVKGQIQTPDGASRVDVVSNEITGLTQRVAHLELDKKVMTNRMAAFEKAMKTPTSNGGFVESAVKQLDGRLQAAEKGFRLMQERLEGVEAAIDGLRVSIRELKEEGS